MSRKTMWIVVSALALFAGCAATAPAERGEAVQQVSLSLTDMAGKTHDLDAVLKGGHSVALVFWQTWCESCKGEAAQVVAAVAREQGVRFVGVIPGKAGVVDDAEVKKVAAAWGYTAFPQVRDTDLSLTKALGVQGTPTVVVLKADAQGARTIAFNQHHLPKDWSGLRGGHAKQTPGGKDCKDGVCPLPGSKGAVQ